MPSLLLDFVWPGDAMCRREHIVPVDERSSAGVIDASLDAVSQQHHERELARPGDLPADHGPAQRVDAALAKIGTRLPRTQILKRNILNITCCCCCCCCFCSYWISIVDCNVGRLWRCRGGLLWYFRLVIIILVTKAGSAG